MGQVDRGNPFSLIEQLRKIPRDPGFIIRVRHDQK
jgi:hypothetical protein